MFLAGGAREPKVGLRLKSQNSYRQTGAPYNMRNKRTDNTASGNNSSYKEHLTEVHLRRQSQRRRPCLHLIRASGMGFNLHLIRAPPDNQSAPAQSNTPKPAPHDASDVRLWDFCQQAAPRRRFRTSANVTKETLSLKAPSVMLRAAPRFTPGLGTIPVQINRSEQSKTGFHNVVEAGVVEVQSHRR